MVAKTSDKGGQGAGLARGLHDQHNGQIQESGHLGRAALGGGSTTIKQAHHPLHKDAIGLAAMPVVDRAHPIPAAEVEIQVAAHPVGGETQQLRIEVVRTNFEGLNRFPTTSGQGGQTEAQKGFAAPT